MTTPDFLRWLETKMAPYAGKLVPPHPVLAERLSEEVRGQLKAAISARVLREAGVEEQVEVAHQRLAPAIQQQDETLEAYVRTTLQEQPASLWSSPVHDLAAELIGDDDSTE